MSYQITVNGADRTRDIINRTVKIDDESKDKPSTLKCDLFDRTGLGVPALESEIIILKDSVKLFGGFVVSVEPVRLGSGEVVHKLECLDYVRSLDRNLVVENYQNMTDKEIIEDIVANYCQGTGITTLNVVEGVTIQNITFNYSQPSQCFRRIAELTGRTWYLDYDKDIHYHELTQNAAPFDIDDANSDAAEYYGLKIKKDNSNIRNRVYVRGGTYLSDSVTIKQVADGEQTVFNLPNKPHEFTMKEGGVSKTVGIKNISSPAEFDYLLNFQEKYVERSDGVAPAADTVMEFTYKYDIPVLVAVEDKDSIEEIGQFEYPIFDNKIDSQEDARTRASAELTDYKNTIVDGSFKTTTDGFKAGQYINIDLTDYDIDDNYLIQKVSAQSIGGGEYEYTIQIANTKKIGIITFLLKMLESDKNFLNLDPNEVVDELFTPDSQGIILSDSLENDSLISPPFKWQPGAGDAKWGLAEWS